MTVRGPRGELTTVAIDLSDVTSTVRALTWSQVGLGAAVHQREAQVQPGESQLQVVAGSFGDRQRILDLAHRDRRHRADLALDLLRLLLRQVPQHFPPQLLARHAEGHRNRRVIELLDHRLTRAILRPALDPPGQGPGVAVAVGELLVELGVAL